MASQALLREQGMQAAADETHKSQLQVIVHRRYNPEGISQYNIVPGLLGVILQMTMVMMTAMALTRETERGTMENLLAMPASPAEIMLGKVLPYLVVGAVQVVVVLVAAKLLFGVPFIGSLTLLLSSVLIFVLALVLLGYTISTVARTQMQAMQLTFFFFLPSILLSGFMFPYRGMPDWAQVFGEIFPLTHFLRIIRGVMLKGADFQAIASEVMALLDLRGAVRGAWRCCASAARWIEANFAAPEQASALSTPAGETAMLRSSGLACLIALLAAVPPACACGSRRALPGEGRRQRTGRGTPGARVCPVPQGCGGQGFGRPSPDGRSEGGCAGRSRPLRS